VGDGIAHPDEKSLIEGLSRISVVKDAADATHESMQNEKGKMVKQKTELRIQETEFRMWEPE
jgi:hypothetical protein